FRHDARHRSERVENFSEVVSLNESFQLRLRLTDPDTVADEVFSKHSHDSLHRSLALGVAFAVVSGMAFRADHRQTRDSVKLAPERISPLLDLENSSRPSRSSKALEGHTRSDPYHKSDDCALGSTSNSQRTSETWHQDFRGDGRNIHGATSKTAVPDVE